MDFLKQSSSDRENLGMLAVMEALEWQTQVTQRELAQTTGLNLKKVNYCLQKLLEKGYVKFHRARRNPNKRGYLYILTPEGLTAKSQLTYGFVKFTLDFYTRMEVKMRRCLREMASQKVKRLVLCGVSDVTRILLDLVDSEDIEIVGIFDVSYSEREYHGVCILNENQLCQVEWDGLLITTLDNLDEVELNLRQIGVSPKNIWHFS